MNKSLLIGAGVFFAIVVIGIIFLGRPKVAPVPVPTAAESVTQATQEAAGEAREVTISGNEYAFSPVSLSVSKGEKIRLTFMNVGSMPHNLMIEGLGIGTKTVSAGKSDIVEFTATESGSFSFYCGVGNHRNLGMEGKMEVE